MAPVKRGSCSMAGRGLGVLAWGLICTLMGCGDSLVDEGYLGTPRFTLSGGVIGSSERVDVGHPEVRLALFWVAQTSPDGSETLVEQEGTSRSAEDYRPFTLKVFDEPRDEDFLIQTPGAKLAVARVGAYQDGNGNQRKDASEPLLGNSFLRILLRAPQALAAADSLTGAPLEEGWHVVSTPLHCPPSLGGSAEPSEDPVPDGDCGVPLGVTCTRDADCNGGTCLLEKGGPWPGGACVIPEPPPNGCRQRGSVLMHVPEDPKQGYWIKACTSTPDCERPFPYQCDQQLQGCKPSAQIVVELSDQERQGPICQQPAP